MKQGTYGIEKVYATGNVLENRMGHILAVVNQKGGVGKTTTAVNLAASLALEKRRVLLVDLDPQGNASSGLSVCPALQDSTVYQVLVGQAKIQEAIYKTEIADLFIVPANAQLVGAEVELVGALARETRLRKALETLHGQYDWIILDCPPSVGLLTVNALTAAHRILIPLQCEYYALEGLSHLLETVRLIQNALNPSLEVAGIVFTMWDARNKLGQQVVEEVLRHFPEWVYATRIPRNVRVSEAPSHGKPAVLYDPTAKGAQAYQVLAEELSKQQKRWKPQKETLAGRSIST